MSLDPKNVINVFGLGKKHTHTQTQFLAKTFLLCISLFLNEKQMQPVVRKQWCKWAVKKEASISFLSSHASALMYLLYAYYLKGPLLGAGITSAESHGPCFLELYV